MKLFYFICATILASSASAEEKRFLWELLQDGYKVVSTSYQVETSREAIYLSKDGKYWVCLVVYNLKDFGLNKAPYVGGGACLPLDGERQ